MNSCSSEQMLARALTLRVVVFRVDTYMTEVHLSHWNKVCLLYAWVKALAAQRCALFSPDHPSTAAQLLRFWLYFMSPNCDWPGPDGGFIFIRGKKGPSCWLGHRSPISVAVCWPPPSQDGEGHISSSSSPWVVWLSAYLHLSAGASFSLHPSPSSLSVRLLNIPHSAPFTSLKQNSGIVYRH